MDSDYISGEALGNKLLQSVREMKMGIASSQYVTGAVSQEQAASLAGLDRVDFLAALAAKHTEVFAVDMDSLKRELEHG